MGPLTGLSLLAALIADLPLTPSLGQVAVLVQRFGPRRVPLFGRSEPKAAASGAEGA